MNNFIRFLLSCAVVIVLVDRSTTFALDSIIKHSGIRYSRMAREHYDVAVLGNSRGVNSVNEAIFRDEEGLEVINLSHNGLRFPEILFLSKSLNDSSTVFVEASAMFWTKPDSKPYDERFDVFKNLREGGIQFLSLAHFNHELFLRSLYYLGGSDAGWANHGTLTSEKLLFLKSQRAHKEMLNCDLSMFELLAEGLKSRGIRTIFYVAPMRTELIESYVNWGSCISALESSYPKDFIDLSLEVEDMSSFADLMHTNNREVRKIHKALLEFAEVK